VPSVFLFLSLSIKAFELLRFGQRARSVYVRESGRSECHRFTRSPIKTINSGECAHVRNSNRAIKLAAMKSRAQLDSPFSAIFRPLLFPVLKLGSYFAEARKKKSWSGDDHEWNKKSQRRALHASVRCYGPRALYCVIHSLESI
jgi:hypothetical protein